MRLKSQWHSADHLRPSHHGKGIMSAAVGAVINRWMIPRLNAHKICTEVFEGNVGSVCVFEKNVTGVERDVRISPECVGMGTTGRIEKKSAVVAHTASKSLGGGGCLSLFVCCYILSSSHCRAVRVKGDTPSHFSFPHLLRLTLPKHGMHAPCNPGIPRNPHCYRSARRSLLRCSMDQVCLLPQGDGQGL